MSFLPYLNTSKLHFELKFWSTGSKHPQVTPPLYHNLLENIIKGGDTP